MEIKIDKTLTAYYLKFWEKNLKNLSSTQVKMIDGSTLNQRGIFSAVREIILLEKFKGEAYNNKGLLYTKTELRKIELTSKYLGQNDAFKKLVSDPNAEKDKYLNSYYEGIKVSARPAFVLKNSIIEVKIEADMKTLKDNFYKHWTRRDLEIGVMALLFELTYGRPLKAFHYIFQELGEPNQKLISVKDETKIKEFKTEAEDMIKEYKDWLLSNLPQETKTQKEEL